MYWDVVGRKRKNLVGFLDKSGVFVSLSSVNRRFDGSNVKNSGIRNHPPYVMAIGSVPT